MLHLRLVHRVHKPLVLLHLGAHGGDGTAVARGTACVQEVADEKLAQAFLVHQPNE